jgi:hypothetical protein
LPARRVSPKQPETVINSGFIIGTKEEILYIGVMENEREGVRIKE